jgi:hypothetical protein
MGRNLAVQGYCLSAGERHRLRVALRFPTGACLPLVATGIALQSSWLLAAMSVIAIFAGFTSRHPFDLLWNHAVRRIFRGPELPPNPATRRHAFKIGALWLLTVAALFAAGASTAGLVVGGLLVAACALVTAVNFCVPSYLIWLFTHVQRRTSWQTATRS